MKNSLLIGITLAFVVSCKSTPTNVTDDPSVAYSPIVVDQSKAISLFNGKDLSGWKIHGTEQWYVEDGLLVCENGVDNTFGYLTTSKHYKDFELTLEYKQEKRGNSGIFVHSIVEGNKATGWQVEIAPPGHNTGGINAYKRGWLAKPNSAKDAVIKMGEWNKMKVQVKGGLIISWLNGTQMVTVNDSEISQSEGGISLQIHGENKTKIKWRNIRLVEL
ncbi:3-keto-disaccharide hydrolase [Psychromonas sp. L1A2]|uniref:3-keto-disaccharide hydrolase n=1 Tax=Psychromonas sp. L1A2 TaxID=2686356 RepID=UPI0013581342|nr:DUF1080 domain-containing protein [Psychromonas sp. L1A2]